MTQQQLLKACAPSVLRIAMVALLAATPLAQAAEFFPVFNQGALQRSATLPALGAAQVSAVGATERSVAIDLTTEYYSDSNARESVLEDGESARIAFGWRAGFAEDWEWNVEVPVLVLGGGFMDRIVEDWHDFFGLPNGGRELAPRNRYEYRYVRDGVTLLDVTDAGTQLGDVRAGLGWQWRQNTAVRAQLKLPTGDGARLGGGNLGGALWLDHALDLGPDSRWSATVSAGASASATSDVLPQLQNRAAAFGGAGLAWRAFERVSFATQLYAHTALFKDSELDGLRNPGLQFVLGTTWHAAPGVDLRLAFQEDPIVSSSPDFSLHFGLALR